MEENIDFEIIYEKNRESYSGSSNESIEQIIKKFVDSKNSKLEDFIFYNKGQSLKPDYNKRIRDSKFGKSKDKKFRIFAFKINHETKDIISEKNENEKNEEKEEEKEPKKEEGKKIEKTQKTHYNDVICPICMTSAIIERNEIDYNINILNCENFHHLNNIQYDIYNEFEFDYNDLIDESEATALKILKYKDLLKCGSCSKSKNEMTPPEDKFYICSCGINLCSICYKEHNEEGHYKIDFNDRNFYCLKHGQKFSKYCLDCNTNLCNKCEDSHNEHEIIKYNEIMPNQQDVKKSEEILEKHKTYLENFVVSIKETFQKMIEKVESYARSYILIEQSLINRYNFNINIIKDSSEMMWNFQLLRNLSNKSLFENDLFNKLEQIYQTKEYDDKLDGFIKIYKNINNPKGKVYKLDTIEKNEEQIPNDSKDEEISIIYKIKEPNSINKNIKIFDPIFVKNNKDRVSVYIDRKKQDELKEYYQNNDKKEQFEVKLIKPKKKGDNRRLAVTDMSYMLNNCKNATSVNFVNWNTSKVTSMEAMFQLSLLSNTDIKYLSNLKTQSLNNIKAMFCKCTKLTNIPEIEGWFQGRDKSETLVDISMLFNGCRQLSGFNFKNWKIYVKDLSYLFSRCTKIKNIENIENLKTKFVKNMCGIFNCCEELINIPSISKWNIEKVDDMSIMFQNCKNARKIELGGSYWNGNDIKDMSGMFSRCTNLTSISNLSKVKVKSLTKLVGMFNDCSSLEKMPDLKDWNTSTVKDIRGMFYNCSKINPHKYLENWNFKNVDDNNFDNVFDQCGNFDGNKIIDKWKSKK